jgi:uncharacterized protein (UPF0335 family)
MKCGQKKAVQKILRFRKSKLNEIAKCDVMFKLSSQITMENVV